MASIFLIWGISDTLFLAVMRDLTGTEVFTWNPTLVGPKAEEMHLIAFLKNAAVLRVAVDADGAMYLGGISSSYSLSICRKVKQDITVMVMCIIIAGMAVISAGLVFLLCMVWKMRRRGYETLQVN